MVTPTRSLSARLSIVPRRLSMAVVILVLLMAVALAFVPSSIAFAGMAPGGSNPHGMAPGGSDGMAPGGSNPHGMAPGGSDVGTAWWAYIY